MNGRPVDSQATTASIVASTNEDGRSASVRDGTAPPRKVASPPVQPTEHCEPAVGELHPIREQLASLAAHETAFDHPPPTHD
eukprot:2807996-Pleurochrysis_carterae.AAC.1